MGKKEMWLCQRWADTIKKAWKLCLSLFSLLSDPQREGSRGKTATKENENVWFLALSVFWDYRDCGCGLRLLAAEYFVMDFLSLSEGWLINWVLFSHPMMHRPITNQRALRALKILTDKSQWKTIVLNLTRCVIAFTLDKGAWTCAAGACNAIPNQKWGVSCCCCCCFQGL